MSQNYYCYIRSSCGDYLEDGYTDSSLCVINSLDFEKLFIHGYSIEIIDFVSNIECPPSFLARYRRLSRRTVDYVLLFSKLPNCKRL